MSQTNSEGLQNVPFPYTVVLYDFELRNSRSRQEHLQHA
jgi:hypothetical protein